MRAICFAMPRIRRGSGVARNNGRLNTRLRSLSVKLPGVSHIIWRAMGQSEYGRVNELSW
jgi:hypothetical protein